jgi:hypothetical protein
LLCEQRQKDALPLSRTPDNTDTSCSTGASSSENEEEEEVTVQCATSSDKGKEFTVQCATSSARASVEPDPVMRGAQTTPNAWKKRKRPVATQW